MNKTPVFILFAVVASFLTACATTDVSKKSEIWPQLPEYDVYYHPFNTLDVDAAVGSIKNMQNSILDDNSGHIINNLDVDRYGMRAKLEWDETTESSHYVAHNGGVWIGNEYVPTYSGANEKTTNTEHNTGGFVIPFDQVASVTMEYFPNITKFKWVVLVGIKDKKPIYLRLETRGDAERLTDSIYSLSTARGSNIKLGFWGVYTSALTELQAYAMNLEPGIGQLIVNVLKEGPSEKAGIQRLDLITEIDGQHVTTNESFVQATAAARSAGRYTVEVKYLRRGYGPDGREAVIPGTTYITFNK